MLIVPTDAAPAEETTQFWKPTDPFGLGPAEAPAAMAKAFFSKPTQLGL